MNFRQLYTSATPQERQETIEQMLQTIEARQHRWILYRGRLIRDRRSASFRGAHERRIRIRIIHPSPRQAGILLLASILNLGVWMFALPYAPQVAPPIVALHLVGLGLLFAFHPMPKPAESSALAQTA